MPNASLPVEEIFTIGQLAKRTGTKVETVRYYERIGLMPNPLRSDGNQRRYDRRHLDRLGFIRHSRELGFPLDDIRKLLDLIDDPSRSCSQADGIARRNLRAVETRIARLEALKNELNRMIAECAHGRIAECRVIEVLADHEQCLHDDHLTP